MFFRLNKMVILSFIALFSLFISSVSFGWPNEDLLSAIGKNNIDDAKKILQVGGVDFQKIDRFFTLPSLEMSQLLLDNEYNKLGLERFLRFILTEHDSQYATQVELVTLALGKGFEPNRLLDIVIKQRWERDNHNGYYIIPLANQVALIKVALSNGAKFSAIDVGHHGSAFSFFPSLEAVDLMLKSGLNPDDLIILILHCSCLKYSPEKQACEVDSELINKRNGLVKFILDKGADAHRLLELIVTQIGRDRSGKGGGLVIEKPAELLKMALGKGAKFSTIRIKYSYLLPTPEVVQIMLEDPCGADLLLQLAVFEDCERYNRRLSDERSKELIEQRDSLMTLAFKKGADPNKIRYFSAPPSIELSKLLFDNGIKPIDPNIYFVLVAKIFCIGPNKKEKVFKVDYELVKQRDELIKFALEKGAKQGKLDDFDRANCIKLLNLVFGNSVFSSNDDHKINIDLVGEGGKTLLMLVAEGGYISIVEQSLDMGANRGLKDNKGKTALDLARERGNSNEYLEELLKV